MYVESSKRIDSCLFGMHIGKMWMDIQYQAIDTDYQKGMELDWMYF